MDSVQSLLDHYRRQRRWTRALAAAIPEAHFDWAPTESTFTCGGLVRHLMQAEIFWRKLLTRAAAGQPYDPFRLSGTPEEKRARFREPNLTASGDPAFGASVADCLERWRPIEAQFEREFAALAPEQLAAPVHHPVADLVLPVAEMFLVMLAHEAHHRGQLSAYLKILGVEQPPFFSGWRDDDSGTA